jgi:hypothetical protein
VSSHQLYDPLNMHKLGQYERKYLRTERPHSNIKVRRTDGSKMICALQYFCFSMVPFEDVAGEYS